MTHPLKGFSAGEKLERNLKIYLRYLKKEPISSIFKDFSITYARCRQIILKMERKHRRCEESQWRELKIKIYLYNIFICMNIKLETLT